VSESARATARPQCRGAPAQLPTDAAQRPRVAAVVACHLYAPNLHAMHSPRRAVSTARRAYLRRIRAARQQLITRAARPQAAAVMCLF
jgi:hypothetical protein